MFNVQCSILNGANAAVSNSQKSKIERQMAGTKSGIKNKNAVKIK